MRWICKIFLAALTGTWLFAGPIGISLDVILQRMARSDSARAEQLRQYGSTRLYILSRGDSAKYAEMSVRMSYSAPGHKDFEVLWQTGSQFVQSRVFHRLLEAEEESAGDERARIDSRNYDFRLAGVEAIQGRRCYVLEIRPRSHSKYLVRGRVWVDADDFAVVRLEGEPVDTGSFWIRNTHIVQTYRKVGLFWLVASNRTEARVRLFGEARLQIDNYDYQVNQPVAETAQNRR